MARSTIYSLALRVTGDTSRLNLTPAEKAVQRLGAETDKVTKVFDRFTSQSDAGARAQQQFSARAEALNRSLSAGQLTAQQYADEFGALAEAANKEAAALERAAQLTARYEPETAKFARTQAELRGQVDAGRISQETYNRAIEDAARNLTDAERSAAGLAARTAEVAASGKDSTLQFNELSGVFSVLPGPLGNIAGRISGITSASQGLSRVFAGGLSQGIASVAGSITALVNPFTVAAAAIVGAGAAANAVVNGLLRLEDRVERLGNLATQLGVSFGFVQVLEEAGNRTGVSVEQLEGAFARLQNTLASGGEESRKASEALGRLGIAVADLEGLTQQERIELFGQQIAAIEDPAQRSAAAIALFGRSGVQLLPFFSQIGNAANDLQAFNAQISDLDRTRIDELGNAFDGVNVALRGFGQELLTPFIGITRSISEGLSPVITTLGRNFGALLDTLSPITSALGLVVNVGLQITATFSRITQSVFEPFAAIGRVVSGVFDRVSQTFTQVFAAINRVVDGFRNFLRFDGAIAAIGAALSRVADVVRSALAPVFERLSAIASRVGEIISTTFSRVQAIFEAVARSIVTRVGAIISRFLEFTGITRTITAAVDLISQTFSSAFDIVSRVVGQIGGLIERVLRFAEDWLGITADISEPVTATVELDTGTVLQELIAENKDLGKVIDDIAKSVEAAKIESVGFGQAGFDAAVRYQESIEELKDKLAGELFNEETFRREAEVARLAFKGELDRISEESRLEIEIEENAARVLQGLRQQISEVIDEASQFGQAGFDAALTFQGALEELQRKFESGVINEEVLTREARRAREEYEAQARAIEEASRAQLQQIENDRQRINSLIEVNGVAQKITEDIGAVDREIARVQQQLTAAIGELDAASAETARRRLSELEGLQQRLAADLQAASQGFEQGFDVAFDRVGQRFASLNDQAAEFGNAGAEAADRLRVGIEAAQQQAEAGILNREAFDREVQRQEQLFQRELEQVRAIADERQRVNQLVDERFALARFGGDQQRLQAAQNLAQLEREIGRVQQEVRAARAAGENDAAAAGAARLAQLDQVAAQERDIASGRRQLEEQINQQRQQALQAIQQQQQAAQEQQKKIREEQEKAAEAEFQRQSERIRDLNTLGTGVISGTDIRTSEGASLFLQLASQRQDPALIEARLQTRRLTEIIREIERLTGLPVITFP